MNIDGEAKHRHQTMNEKDTTTRAVVQTLKAKAARLPLGFMLGAVVGGGLYLYATRNRRTRAVRAITDIARLAAPYVIVAILERVASSGEDNLRTATVPEEAAD